MGRRRPIFSRKKSNKKKFIIAVLTAIILCLAVFHYKVLHLLKLEPEKPIQQHEQTTIENHSHPVGYKRVQTQINGKPQVINLLEVDLNRSEVDIKAILAQDEIHGYEATSSMLARKGAYAGVNGGFFNTFGQPAGMVVINGKALTSSQGYPVFGIGADNKAFIEKIRTRIQINAGGRSMEISGINRMPRWNETVALTEEFGETTRISKYARNIVIENNTVKDIEISSKPVSIPKGGMVVVCWGKPDALLKELKVGQQINLDIGYEPQRNIKNAIECGAWIIRDGKVVVPGRDMWIGPTDICEPRTAIGLTGDNKLILLTVDGRQQGKSIGLTGKELADYMIRLGVNNAAFLDGGGSTTMWVEGKVVNTPSFHGEERMVGNALGVFLRKQ